MRTLFDKEISDSAKVPAAQRIASKIPILMYGKPVPTFISECPYCGEPIRWGTTGLLCDLTCKKCGGLFKMF